MRAIIIEDELHCQDVLVKMIPLITKEIKIIGTAVSVESGLELIKKEKPDVVFLDIELNDGSGFDLLNQCKSVNFFTVFVTSYENYALKAIEYAPIDYILKPVLPSDLGRAIQKVLLRKGEIIDERNSSIEKLSDSHSVITNGRKYRVTNHDEILYIQADQHYCEVYLSDGERMISSETLANFEKRMPPHFFRLHKSTLVNLKRVKSFQLKENPTIVLSNEIELKLAHRRKKDFETAVKEVFKNFN